MHSALNSTLRTRLVLLVLLAVVPALGLILYTASEQRRTATLEAQEQALRLARLAANNQKQVVEGTRQMLIILAQMPVIRNGNSAQCNQFLADILKQNSVYANFAVLDVQGKTICTGIPYSGWRNPTDRSYFQRALKTRKFTIGEYQIGRATKKATLNFAYPILDKTGQVQTLVIAALDLAHLNQLAARVKMPKGSVLSVVDQTGKLLVRYPNTQAWVGKSLPENAFTRMKNTQGEGIDEVNSLDGVRRIFAFVPLGDNPGKPDEYVRVGIPQFQVLADADHLLGRNLISLGAVTFLALIAAWVGGDVFFIRQIKSLVQTAKTLGSGQLNTRTKLPYKSGELGELAQAIDEMAAALEGREMAIASLSQNMRTLFELIPIGILITEDMEFKEVRSNPAFAEILGISPEDNISYTPVNAPRPSYRIFQEGKELSQQEFPLRYAAIHNTEVKGTEVDIVRGDGSIFNLFGYAAPLLDKQGNPRGSVAAFLDITERKQTEQRTRQLMSQVQQQAKALQESEQSLRMAQRAGKIGTWEWNLMTDEVSWSEGIWDILGLEIDTEEPGVKPWLDFIHPDDQERIAQGVKAVLAEGKDYYDEFRIIRRDNTVIWLASKGQIIRDADGKAQRFLGVNIDITDRKQAEEVRRESEERFQAFMEHSPAAAWITDTDGQIIYLSPTYVKTFQLLTQDAIGKSVFDLFDIDIATQFLNNIQIAAKTNQVLETIEIAPRLDSTIGEFLVYKFPIANLSGQALVGGVAIDVTARRRAEEEREELLLREQAAREAAENANRIKDEFLAVLSHELRTPLSPILGWVKLLRTRQLDEEKKAIALETIERNAKLQTQLIGDLLDVSRILQGKFTLNISPVDLVATVGAAKETVRLAAEAKAIEIHTEVAGDIQPFMGDSGRLQQVVWNLLTNAVKFTPNSGQVKIKLESTNTYTEIQISDTGKGITPEFLPYVFETFRQADSATTRKFGGLGLGLAIVRHIVEMHGGTVHADSPGVDQGATFTVKLPMITTNLQPDQNKNLPSTSLSLRGVRVLIVEDEQDTRELLVYTIEQYGAEVTGASSVREALKILQQSLPDILVCDIAMPEMDGYTLIREIRTWTKEQGGEIPAIALTAYAGEVDQKQALAAGFQRHLSKPVDPEQLAQAIVLLMQSSPSSPFN
ncbi:PAS domain S-box protein [Aetokthonos hydrillicola Thurmond2011]|jgi:PAS domain S-box-containing protein|uniref:histidine kinase n=1 Tax=Aetokthonos hydrillicola Thurmond2011 TaxID=2712845 RepID=A0AAP5MBT4_9CYAN|nr:PAS domain S-box protein [Aetokthonos hydrillicola]MBO3459170.1 PAS domain S-box protein [Aetokthonos hydrillicola CCALA 1050]MBW4584129.1 PAS domain S-box protein [Aetokthonos hydrillicola CCALA 1050]MDR9898337.1 PAS domain S-box protein [Aetokthonos hydrillicola Thurmond2011]